MAPNEIKNIIGIMSGKGGVGKSTISYLIATALQKRGFKVGIMDADITGPSIPKFLNLNNISPSIDEKYIYPFLTKEGIKVISINLFLEDETQPVIWRGPLLSKAIEQFWEEVHWGELDFLIVDMPPGTSDISLTIMQKITLTGLIFVTTPDPLVSIIVEKAKNMANIMNIKVLGLIENMSYFVCPKCGEKIDFFNKSKENENLGLEVLIKIPMRIEIASLTSGNVNSTNETVNNLMEEISNKILNITQVKPK